MLTEPRAAVSCPVCGDIVRTDDGDILRGHYGYALDASGTRTRPCPASWHTVDEARATARREAAELDALRLRAHP